MANNRGLNIFIYMIAAIVFNMVLTVLTAAILLLAIIKLFPNIPAESMGLVLLFVFIASVVVTFFAYKKVLIWANKRWNLEEKLGKGNSAK